MVVQKVYYWAALKVVERVAWLEGRMVDQMEYSMELLTVLLMATKKVSRMAELTVAVLV
jgi:hypothetical protein